jgi:hypothetical protein
MFSDLRKLRFIFYSLWLLVNFLQAGFTSLLYDEAYYWICSFHIDWGHYYYPPFNDLFIQAGYFFLKNEAGVRLFFVLGSTLAIYLIEKLTFKEDLVLFYSMVASLLFFQIAGIIAAPDIPLFLFSVIFYTRFKKYLESDSLFNGLILGLITAILLYIKYHAILVIGFSFLFNLPVLYKRRSAYLWVISAMVFYLPHIYWQISNNFPTLLFHIAERPGAGFMKWRNLSDYLPGQLLLTGPVISIFLWYAVFKIKLHTRFEKTLRFNLFGMYIFFFLISFYHHIEVNWTITGLIPLLLLSHSYIAGKPGIRRWIFRTLPLSLLIILAFRLYLIFPQVLPESRFARELHGYKEWAAEMKEFSSGDPVVFLGRYQIPSIYAFYAKDPSVYSFSPRQKNDYLYFPTEDSLQGKAVIVFSSSNIDNKMDSLQTGRGIWFVKRVERFRSHNRLWFKVMEDSITVAGNQVSVPVEILNPYPGPLNFAKSEEDSVTIGYQLFKEGRVVDIRPGEMDAGVINDASKFTIHFKIEENHAEKMQLLLKSGWFPPNEVSKPFYIK